MHLDIGTIVWLAIVLIGVISSLRKNAAKRAPVVIRQAPEIVSAAPVVVPAPPQPIVPAPPPLVAPETPPLIGTIVRPVGTSPVRGMFEGPATLVRAIVAAEVLGPPKSMQEQTLWSPRHSEPSI